MLDENLKPENQSESWYLISLVVTFGISVLTILLFNSKIFDQNLAADAYARLITWYTSRQLLKTRRWPVRREIDQQLIIWGTMLYQKRLVYQLK
jgi:hypothetical protein